MAGLGAAAPAIMAGATVLQASGTIASSKATSAAAQSRVNELHYEQEQLLQDAGQAEAAGQRGAITQQRDTDYLASRALALAGASGGGTTGTVEDVISKIRGEGSYRSMSALYEGETQARQLKMAAETKGWEAANVASGAAAARRAVPLSVASTVLGGAANIGSMYSRYWAGGSGNPGTTTRWQTGPGLTSNG